MTPLRLRLEASILFRRSSNQHQRRSVKPTARPCGQEVEGQGPGLLMFSPKGFFLVMALKTVFLKESSPPCGAVI